MKVGGVCILSAIWLIATLVEKVEGHGNGAPESRCESMSPGHWVASQTTPCPYTVTLDKSIVPAGSPVTLSLSVTSPDQPGFKGFFVMVKKPSELSNNYGTFDIRNSDLIRSQPVNCFGRESSAMTHKDNIEKSLVRLVWTAPLEIASSSEDFEVKVTFVQNFWTIWANLTGPQKITVVTINDPDTSFNKKPVHSFINLAQPSTSFSVVSQPTPSVSVQEKETSTRTPSQVTPEELGQELSSPSVIIHKSFHVPRDDMSVINSALPTTAEKNKTNNIIESSGPAAPPTDGAWGHFKNMWMSVLNYFGA